MKNYVKDGKSVAFTMTGAVSSGDVVKIGKVIGVAQADAAIGDRVELLLEGVVSLPRAPADVFTEGADVYWDGSLATVVVTGDKIGSSIQALSAAAGSVEVRFNGVSV